jgi:flavin-binding protein dodecin
VDVDEGGGSEARGVEVRSFKGTSEESYEDALQAAIDSAVHAVGPGRYWEVSRKSIRGDNPRIGEYRVWITESRP